METSQLIYKAKLVTGFCMLWFLLKGVSEQTRTHIFKMFVAKFVSNNVNMCLFFGS